MRMRTNGCLGASGEKSDVTYPSATTISCNRGITLLSEYIFAVRRFI